MDAMEYFLGYLLQLRMILDQWTIPFLGCSYWDFIMGVAIASVVITVLVSAVRIGTVTYSDSRQNSIDSKRREKSRVMRQETTKARNDYNKWLKSRF